ncbi:NAD(P)-dependent alcohol dehydrogenase [Pseudomonas sp. P7759]|uniref:zinc-dependent alcohol dehydrogenase family protein n=1 Tax=Pseudomonas sp. P7759 TaxID=2738831 RepID=UPI0015A402A2|nr:NAD(P)-dependent alcohol dehydrogenase [Pseudomonas sp. P7759]NWC77861.1 NAD(P)-dependent alcohol dehydrogenase [Pseudomonas sp. P7759]
MTDMMQRWEIPSFGLHTLHLARVPRPVAKAGEVLVRVAAVSLNYRDAEVAENGMGASVQFPFTPASDMTGTVMAVGEGVQRFSVGDQVLSSFFAGWVDGQPLSWTEAPPQGGPIPGMLAEYVATPAEWCVLAPRSLSAAQASTLPVAGLTAWMALVELGHLHAGQTVVVQGTGGVSLFAVQLAAVHGARVIITSSSDDKIARAVGLGATHGIHRGRVPDWHTSVLELTGGRGAEHVLEMAGGDNLARSLQAVANGGRISVIGLLESDQLSAPLMSLLAKRASIVGVAVGPRRALEDLIRMVDRHTLAPVIDHTYRFTEVPQAFTHLKRGAFGKVVIEVSP